MSEMKFGRGRPKGVPNKVNGLLKEAILKAADEAGGVDGLVGYLKQQAIESPNAFLPLLGKVLPLQIAGEDGGPLQIAIVKYADNQDS